MNKEKMIKVLYYLINSISSKEDLNDITNEIARIFSSKVICVNDDGITITETRLMLHQNLKGNLNDFFKK